MAEIYVKGNGHGVFTSVGRNKAAYKRLNVDYDVKHGDSVYVMLGGNKVVWVFKNRLVAQREADKIRQPPLSFNKKVATETGKIIPVGALNDVQLQHCVVQ